MTSAAPKPASSFEAQVEAARLLVIEAQRLRGRKLLFVFESRVAVWVGVEQALRELRSLPARRPDGKRIRKNRVAAYMDSDVLKQALAGSSNRWSPNPPGSVEDDAFFRRLHDETAVVSSHVADHVPTRFGLPYQGPSEETRRLEVRRVLEGHKLDESLWRYDFGILDEDFGCPDDQRRALHEVRIRSGLYAFDAVCKPCNWLTTCRYQKGTLGATGIIVGHHSDMTFERVVSVLFGGVPPAAHRVERSRLGTLKDICRTRMSGGVAELDVILNGGRVNVSTLKTLKTEAMRLHHAAALDETSLRTKYNELKSRRRRGKPSSRQYVAAGKALRQATKLRQDLCGLKLMFDLGRWPELLRGTGIFIQRPVVMPPLHGLFIAFPDNVDDWRGQLEPFGAKVVRWTEVTNQLQPSIRQPAAPKDLLLPVARAAARLMRRGVASPTQVEAAAEVPMPLATLKDRLKRKGWSWAEILDAARDIRRMETP